ncbi:hypothetical protein JB92DRAFT_2834837 [Gautieria morchelliformis]|nr:hypothetical protein JB92DRAFT_2834837 [Gautieria morchelliformis]
MVTHPRRTVGTKSSIGERRGVTLSFRLRSVQKDQEQNPAKNEDPRKGRYLSALESRLHEAEALLGVIISSNDVRAKTLVFDLAKDSLASTIIKRVTHSVFGPVGRESLRVRGAGGACSEPQVAPAGFRRPTDSRRQQMNSREVAMMGDDGNLVFTTPSNTWQDYLSNRLATEATYTCDTFSTLPVSTSVTSIASKASSSRDADDGNIESDLSGIPSDQWSASSSPVFGEQDQSHFPNSLCLEGTYSFGRRISAFSKNTNDTEDFLTSGDHTIPKYSTSTTQTGGWAGMLSHENHHSSRLFGQDQFVESGLDSMRCHIPPEVLGGGVTIGLSPETFLICIRIWIQTQNVMLRDRQERTFPGVKYTRSD